MSHLALWVKELRAPFFTATIIPVLLGTTIAWNTTGSLHAVYFVLNLIAAVCLHAGANMANDYFDFKSGCDLVNKEFVSPFSGGSRLLPEGKLRPRSVYIAALSCFALGSFIGIVLALERGWIILLFGVIGILSGYCYTTHLATSVLGEVFVGLNFGPLLVLGSYYVQAQRFALEPIVASIPVGLLITSVLWINEVPDYVADRSVGKNTWVVRLGRKRATDVFAFILMATYLSTILGIALGWIPVFSLMILVTMPMAHKAISIARKHYEETDKLFQANATTIQIHLLTGLLFTLGYLVQHFFPSFIVRGSDTMVVLRRSVYAYIKNYFTNCGK